MADNEGGRRGGGGGGKGGFSAAQPPSSSASRPTTIALPPRSFGEMMFTGGGPNSAGGFGFGFSPGPMTLVSSLFADGEDCKSFSQLLAGVMSPGAASKPQEEKGSGGLGVNRPANLSIAPPPPASMFMVPPGMTLLDSPAQGLFSPQGAYGMTHQQALAQVTAQAGQGPSSFSQMSSSTTDSVHHQQIVPSKANLEPAKTEPSAGSYPNQRFQISSVVADKPADDGYNWRKYGQKQVKGSEFPRSYYKCTHLKCPVTKKVERSLEGQVTEIIYKGQHNHLPPQSNKRGKHNGNANGVNQGNPELASQFQTGNPNKSKERRDQESSQATGDHLSVTSDSEEGGDTETAVEDNDDVEPDAKRRNIEVRVTEPTSSHRTVTEPRIIVQTTSEVDLLDDGYRWRKYGQKVVKGNPYPRSYYKCTTQGCNVRKHVERAASDPKAVITTYEGKHNHDVPAAKNSSHNIANSLNRIASNSQQPIAQLRLKEEQIT